MKYGLRMPDLGKSIAAKLSVNRMLRQQLGFGKGLIPNRKKAKYNKKYSKMVKRMEDIKGSNSTTQSERIKKIQSKLKAAGIYRGPLTGILDIKTINAIRIFQRKHNISVTGMLDFKTLMELEKGTIKDKNKKKNK